jgi:hypothetical protein
MKKVIHLNLVKASALNCLHCHSDLGHVYEESPSVAAAGERARYPKFRRQYLFVGSGVIEAGCKTVIGSRLKQSGMFWTVRGANAILALRCSHLNDRFEDYWEERRAA